MQTISMHEIQSLYNMCGIITDGIEQARREINTGDLSNNLNTNFSNIYGTDLSNNMTSTTVTK